MPISEDQVRDQLKLVIDPELFVNIVDLGLIYVVDIQPGEDDKQNVNVEMTLTSPMCPAGPQLVANSRQVIESIEGVGALQRRSNHTIKSRNSTFLVEPLASTRMSREPWRRAPRAAFHTERGTSYSYSPNRSTKTASLRHQP